METNEGLRCKLIDNTQLSCWLKGTNAITKVGSSSVTVSSEIGSCWGTRRIPSEHTELVSIIEKYYQNDGDDL